MKKWWAIICIFVSLNASGQIFEVIPPKHKKAFEFGESQLGLNITPSGTYGQLSLEKLIGIEDVFSFSIRASFLMPIGSHPPMTLLQAGAGLGIDDNTTLFLYPF